MKPIVPIAALGLAMACLQGPDASAGGGPQNVLLVVNQQLPESPEIGKYYAELRGIPERNIVHMDAGDVDELRTSSYSNGIEAIIQNYIADSGLSNQIDYIVYARKIPHRIKPDGVSGDRNGISSVTFYGYKSAADNCDLPAFTQSDYYETETASTHAGQPSQHRYYLSSVINALDVNQGRTLIDRSVSADFTVPTGSLFLLHTDDAVRNVRWTQFDEAAFSIRALNRGLQPHILVTNGLAGQSNIVGLSIGTKVDTVTSNNNAFVPGALADHLTSFGGKLFDSGNQMSILHWIKAGCSGSYGTVIEPCNHTNKFPAVRLHYWYARGFDMAESYMMSVQNPFQGVIVGDPLCAPYATPP